MWLALANKEYGTYQKTQIAFLSPAGKLHNLEAGRSWNTRLFTSRWSLMANCIVLSSGLKRVRVAKHFKDFSIS